MHTLTLPQNIMVLESSPAPVEYRTDEGRLVLAWEPAESTDSLLVRFRMDGMLAAHWAMRSSVEAYVTRFVAAWNGTADGLDKMLDPTFTLLPTGARRAAVLGDAGKRGRLGKAKIADLTIVGDTITVDLLASWDLQDRNGKPFQLAAWPVVLQIRAGAQQTVRVMSRGSADRGSCTAEGYAHEGLRVRWRELAGTRIRRTRDAAAELQIELTTPTLPGVAVQVVGLFAEADAQLPTIRFRLSNGASVLRPGLLLTAEHQDVDGWTAMDWRFEQGDGCARERWRLGTRGRRHFLVRCVVEAANSEQAETRFGAEDVQQWFAAVTSSLVVD
jgi:hypothetical protein